MTTPDRPVRFCPICKIADTDPRHAIYGDDPNVAKHMDCCRDAICPDGTCAIILKDANGAKGMDLVAHIESLHETDEFHAEMAARPEEVSQFTTETPPIILRRVDE